MLKVNKSILKTTRPEDGARKSKESYNYENYCRRSALGSEKRVV